MDEASFSHAWTDFLEFAIYTREISAMFNIRNLPPKITTLRVTPEPAEGLPARTQRFFEGAGAALRGIICKTALAIWILGGFQW